MRRPLACWRPGQACDREIDHSRRRTTLRKLIESTLVSLDGVIEAPERSATFDAEDTALSLEQLGNYDAFVLGWVTDETFSATWGHTAGNPYTDRIAGSPGAGGMRRWLAAARPQQRPAASPHQAIIWGAAGTADRCYCRAPCSQSEQAAYHDRPCPSKTPNDLEDTHDR